MGRWSVIIDYHEDVLQPGCSKGAPLPIFIHIPNRWRESL